MPILSSALDKRKALPSRDMQELDEKEASLYAHDDTASQKQCKTKRTLQWKKEGAYSEK